VVVSKDAALGFEVEIPQVLSAAMAAGVYICIAQRAGGYFLDPADLDWQSYLISFFALFTIAAWNAKNFIDDFKAFARRDDDGFSLGPTVGFSAATFTMLGIAATLLFGGVRSVWALAGFFLLSSIWSATSWRRRKKKNRHDIEIPKRWIRMILYFECFVLLAGAAFSESRFLSFASMLCALLVFVYDARDYKTFSSSSQEVLT
jgi:hypothetical protein